MSILAGIAAFACAAVCTVFFVVRNKFTEPETNSSRSSPTSTYSDNYSGYFWDSYSTFYKRYNVHLYKN